MMNSVELQLKQYLRGTPLRKPAKRVKEWMEIAHHVLAEHNDTFLRPRPKSLFVSLTANCNLRCKACHYGRDFMPGHQLPWSIGAPMIDDAKELGFHTIRLYGGEPLIHKDIAKYVERISSHGMNMWLTTNGMLLDKKIDSLVDAGLNRVSVGFYGLGESYDRYVQRKNAFGVVEKSIAATRGRYGSDKLRMHLDWVLMRPTSDPETVAATLRFARDHDLQVFVNLIHYSLPYFATDEESDPFGFDESDRGLLNEVVSLLIETKQKHPDLLRNSTKGLRSIPDWLILKSDMKIPCTAYEMVWVGPDGTVQMCYVTFRLGNLHEARLSELLFTPEHEQCARDGFNLKCPNCHCRYDVRVLRHPPSRRRY